MIGEFGNTGALDVFGALMGTPTTTGPLGMLAAQPSTGMGGLGALDSRITPQQLQALLMGANQFARMMQPDEAPISPMNVPDLGQPPIEAYRPQRPGQVGVAPDPLTQILMLLKQRGLAGEGGPLSPLPGTGPKGPIQPPMSPGYG